MGDLPKVLGRWQGICALPPILKFPHSLFSSSPSPTAPSPHTTRLLLCQPTGPLAHLPPLPDPRAPQLRIWELGKPRQGSPVSLGGSDWELTPPDGTLCI